MKLIIGLGNPGNEYKLSRHNIGFLVLERFAGKNNIRFKSNTRFKALIGEGLVGREPVYLAMPQTFMNLSGHSVRSIFNWLKIDLAEALVVVDDISLPFGKIRIRPKGSDGGHNGLRSIIDCLSSPEFSRMRIGIMGRRNIENLSKYVLTKFTKLEQKKLLHLLETASEACECWIKEGVDVAMNGYNRLADSV